MTKPSIKIDIISDVVCPWCYIGKRRLEKALDQLSDRFDFQLEYHPFELNPQMPPQGVNQQQYLTKKFGDPAQYQQITRHVSTVAAQEGLAFNFDKQEISPNTRHAHRLIGFANQYGKQVPLVEAFFKAYFTDGVDLSKKENLISVAVEAGLDRERVEQLQASEVGLQEVAQAEQEISQLGITGVPFYVINNTFGISGAQTPAAFIEAIEKLELPVTQDGDACDTDGSNC